MPAVLDFERGRLLRERAAAAKHLASCILSYETALQSALDAVDLRTTASGFDVADRAQLQVLQAAARLRRVENEIASLPPSSIELAPASLATDLAVSHGDAA